MSKLDCPNCGVQVESSPFCRMCGASLRTSREQLQGLDAYAFYDRAKSMYENFGKTSLVQIQVLKMPDDGSLPNVKDIRVTEGNNLFVYSSLDSSPQQLRPGTYSARELFAHRTLGRSIQRLNDGGWCCLCTVRTRSFQATFALPDPQLLDESLLHGAKTDEQLTTSVKQALRSLSLLDANDLFGGAQAQLDLQCLEPARLMESTIHDYLEHQRPALEPVEAANVLEDDDLGKTSVKKRGPKNGGVWHTMKSFVGRAIGNRSDGRAHSPNKFSVLFNGSYSLRDLYSRIHLEYRASIQQAMRNLTALDLYDNVSVRLRVEEEIKRTMCNTLEGYGMTINRVSAFQFHCPDFDRQRERRGDIRIAKDDLTTRADVLDINKKNRELKHEEEQHVAMLRDKKERSKIEADAATSNMADAAADEAQDRQLAMRAKREEHDRQKRAGDVRLEQELKAEKLNAHLVHHKKYLETVSEHERRTMENQLEFEQKRLKMYSESKLPAELTELLLAQNDPHSAVLYIKNQRLKSEQEKVEMLEGCRKQLESAYGKSSKEVVEFSQEVVKQIGKIVGKRIEFGRSKRLAPPPE